MHATAGLNPYAFTGVYSHCYINRDMAMDERHVFMVHEILKSWPFKNALELGSFWGASSTAFVEAINGGAKMRATFCDTTITPGLWDVVHNCKRPDRVRVTREPSFNVLESAEDFDFILVDADHKIQSVQPEIDRLLIRKPLCVVAHDTNATAAGYRCAEGAALLKSSFQSMLDYYCLEDHEKRDGEQTERGLFLATTSPELHGIAQEIYSKYP